MEGKAGDALHSKLMSPMIFACIHQKRASLNEKQKMLIQSKASKEIFTTAE